MQVLRLLACCLLCSILYVNSIAQKSSKIELVNAGVLEFGDGVSSGARRLIGNVILRQDDVTMYCDSARLFPDQNMFEAFSHIHLTRRGEQNFDIFSQQLVHDGNLKISQFRDKVVMTDKKVTLTTDYFDYHIDTKTGFYTQGGEIVDSASVLTSLNGNYYGKEQKFIFSKNVKIENEAEKFVLKTDSMHYHADTKTVWFFGPTHVISDTNYLYARHGWYNTETGFSQFTDSVRYESKGRYLLADKVDANRNDKKLTASGNVFLNDTARHFIATGQFMHYTDSPQFFILTRKAVVIYIDQSDSLFLHADTITSYPDSAGFKIIHAFHHVKAWRSDFQLKCDSLVFTESDSLLRLFGSPVVWSQDNQLTSVDMTLKMKNGQPYTFFLSESAMIISQVDPEKYNQISGKSMTGFISKKKLNKVNVDGMSQSIYYTTDNRGVFGINAVACKNMTIYLENKEVKRIILFDSPKGTMNPPKQLSQKETRLKGFVWHEKSRPLNSRDIFRWE